MKKLLVTALIGLAATAAQADPHHHRGYGYHNQYNWVAPMVFGGIVTYALTRPQPPVVVQQPVFVQPYPAAPYGYHYENILDANCNCYRLVLVQN